jgi:hypothetical protein
MSPTSPHARRLIELRLSRLDQLFDPLDPFPVPSRDISRSAEDFMVGWARDFPSGAPLGVRIHLPSDVAKGADLSELETAFRNHFTYRANRMTGDMRELFANGRAALAIGLCVLGACIVTRQLLRGVISEGTLGDLIVESLVIVGWVANWRPIEILLYEWWPIARRRSLYQRLAEAPVELAAEAAAGLEADRPA